MKIVREIKKGRYKLTHSRYVDSGLLRDAFNLQVEIAGGLKVNMPFHPEIVADERDSRERGIFDTTQEFRDEDYELMFERNRLRFAELHPDLV